MAPEQGHVDSVPVMSYLFPEYSECRPCVVMLLLCLVYLIFPAPIAVLRIHILFVILVISCTEFVH